MYHVIKSYGHELGFSTTFRQWRARSHCAKLHGYALRFEFHFEAETLDARNWVVDFGSLRFIRDYLKENFDHVTYVAEDDPHRHFFETMRDMGLITLGVVPAVGMEAFAKHVFDAVSNSVSMADINELRQTTVRLAKVLVYEHPANAAGYSA